MLAALPSDIRRDVITARQVSVVSVLFKLWTVYQRGGAAERTSILKSLTEMKVGTSVTDLLQALRTWRRLLGRAEEIKVAIPDPSVLMSVLGKASEGLIKVGGHQASYRISRYLECSSRAESGQSTRSTSDQGLCRVPAGGSRGPGIDCACLEDPSISDLR